MERVIPGLLPIEIELKSLDFRAVSEEPKNHEKAEKMNHTILGPIDRILRSRITCAHSVTPVGSRSDPRTYVRTQRS